MGYTELTFAQIREGSGHRDLLLGAGTVRPDYRIITQWYRESLRVNIVFITNLPRGIQKAHRGL